MKVDWLQVQYVGGAGALGGVLSWIYSAATGSQLELGWFGSLLASVLLGGGAAVLGVYLIAKTDLSATLHALAFAMACGFVSAPYFSRAYRALFGRPPREDRRFVRMSRDPLKASAQPGAKTLA